MTERFWITALGPSVGERDRAEVASVAAAHGARGVRARPLSEGPLRAFEWMIALSNEAREGLRRALRDLGTREGFDVALLPEGPFRREKRLAALDMDSTLIQVEVIDELAKVAGKAEQVAAITERAMRGELDYRTSLRDRLSLLAGLEVEALRKIASALPLTEGAERLVRVLRRLGCRTVVLSGGFSLAAEALRDRLGLDEAHSNVLEVEDGRLTGRVEGEIFDGAAKAACVERMAKAEGLVAEQVVAVGDGANDLPMLSRAGLGIAFRAKPKVREAADVALDHSGLDAVLYLLGMSDEEIAQVEVDAS